MMVPTLAALIARAVGQPTYRRHGWKIHEWDISGSCEKPQTRELHARPLIMSGREYLSQRGGQTPLTMILHTRCRQCATCLRLRSREWRLRAVEEMRDSARTWFGTLTLRPAAQHLMLSQARQRLWSGGTDFDALSPAEQFAERMTEIGKEVTRYLKRVRKESGARVRYLLVAERHKSGFPHLHIMVHEADIDRPVRYATLASQWKLGFVHFKLAHDTKTAAYVCKYISKALLARVRASLRYGLEERKRPQEHNEPRSGEVWKKAPERGSLFDVKATPSSVTKWDPLCGYSLTDHYGGKKSNELLPRPTPFGEPWKPGLSGADRERVPGSASGSREGARASTCTQSAGAAQFVKTSRYRSTAFDGAIQGYEDATASKRQFSDACQRKLYKGSYPQYSEVPF